MEILAVIVILILCILLFVSLGSRSSTYTQKNRQTFETTNKTAEIGRLPVRGFTPRRSDNGNFSLTDVEGSFVPKAPINMFKPREAMVFSSRGTKMDLDAPCYLTGQPISSCRCEECKSWRQKHVQ